MEKWVSKKKLPMHLVAAVEECGSNIDALLTLSEADLRAKMRGQPPGDVNLVVNTLRATALTLGETWPTKQVATTAARALEHLQEILWQSVLRVKADETEEGATALVYDVHASPEGRFLYVLLNKHLKLETGKRYTFYYCSPDGIFSRGGDFRQVGVQERLRGERRA